MKRRQKIFLVLAGTALLFGGLATAAAASGGLVGQCADCHTMHNSEQGQPVALQGSSTTPTGQANPNLLKMDCIACHASGGAEKIMTLDGGSNIPQVFHTDTTDLAGGNFAYISGFKPGHEGTSGNRKGHNVVDVVPMDSTFTNPPGFRHAGAGSGNGEFDVAAFTCAGSMGCHGVRGQLLTFTEGSSCDPVLDENCEVVEATYTFRTGLAAFSGYEASSATAPSYFSGAHHDSYDGYKADGIDASYDASPLAKSYRFIARLRGYGNETDRWQNVDANSHNEYRGGYFSNFLKELDYTNTTTVCNACHINGQGGTQSRLNVPSSSMTGFCITCHSTFHSAGVVTSSGTSNGTSGAFLRHPSDYVLPGGDTEYANYTVYDVTAPVARPTAFFAPGMTASSEVRPGTDMVMCLSCHVAHASPHDGMLRFDYTAQSSAMRAGIYASIEDAQAEGGCLACHTTKGVAKGP